MFYGDQRTEQSVLHEWFELVREELVCCFCVPVGWRFYNVGARPGAVVRAQGTFALLAPCESSSEVMAHPLSQLGLHNRLPFIEPQANRAEGELEVRSHLGQ